MRLAVAGGGTGGHIYPAVAAMEALASLGEATEVLWLGVSGGPEEAVARRYGWEFGQVRAVQVRGTGVRMPANAVAGFLSAADARRALLGFGAEVLLATGGYVSVPGALGAKLARVPVVLFLPDASPGWAIRLLRPLADGMAASSVEAATALGRGAVVTGYPVRRAFFDCRREEARRALGLGERPALLVLGGSSGARRLNQAVLRWAGELLKVADILHVAGRRDHEAVAEEAEAAGLTAGEGYHLFAYLDRLPEAMVASDLVVSRAGAAVLGELTAAGRPAVLVPGSFAGGHQRHNAAYLQRNGCAVVVEDEEVLERLGPEVLGLLRDEGSLRAMSARAKALAVPDAAERLAQLLQQMSRGGRFAH
ncbi:MAG: UDP-N-acetylglucosamine--N-acetylmuramyl-(pentapeptide) pyrophosphoryl-undecaprenol N-acetylglucosamine transferase [Anaerolineae bacterium]|nr:UDP-N-acetylglucosamine--N-acetylmuramyl-(pentapeptide) pyrophosphoryl-undecaprenol N-acetylglucosamine transferase [Anaerolineae bacterium]